MAASPTPTPRPTQNHGWTGFDGDTNGSGFWIVKACPAFNTDDNLRLGTNGKASDWVYQTIRPSDPVAAEALIRNQGTTNSPPYATKHEFATYDWSAPANSRWQAIVNLRNSSFAAKYLRATNLPDGTHEDVLCDATVDGASFVTSNGDIQYLGCPLVSSCVDDVYIWNWASSAYDLYYSSPYVRGSSSVTGAGWYIDEFVINLTNPDPVYSHDLGFGGPLFNGIGSDDGSYIGLTSNVIPFDNVVNYPMAHIVAVGGGVVAVPFGIVGVDPSPSPSP